MPFVPDVVANAPILSSWGNTIRNQTVMPFTNAAQRTSQWLAPPAGALSWLADQPGLLHIYNGTAWRAYVPGGNLARAQPAPGSVAIAPSNFVDLAGMAVTVTVPAGRKLRITLQVQVGKTPADVQGNLGIAIATSGHTNVTNGSDIPGADRLHWCVNSGVNAYTTVTFGIIVTPAAGTFTWKARAQSTNGNVYFQQGYLEIDDVGAA